MNFKKIFCSILFLFFIVNAFSQDAISTVQQSFEKYNAAVYQEKVFLHTDKTVYITGEILWFKCYITDAVSNHLSALSKICYIEVINNDNRQLLQAKIAIDSGTGNGSITIPSSIRTGNYLLRAYTSWMKNFDPGFYFEQSISIINPDKKAGSTKMDTIPRNSIEFFPEGGNLVYGLNNTVAFKVTNAYGKGVSVKGIIVNGKNDTILNFETERFGMGTFIFNPIKDNEYHCVININNKTLTYTLPEIYTSGWAMHLKDEGSTLRINVTTNVETEHTVYLFVQAKGLAKYAKIEYLKKGVAEFIMNKSDIGDGISQLTVFNENKQPVCERLYFKRPTRLLQIKLLNSGTDFQTRKKVTLNILTNEASGNPVNADMSVAVYLLDSLQPEQEMNILNYLWLSSDIKGTVESPQYYFNNSGAEVDKATDNLMLTQGWRRFKWEDVLKNTKPAFKFLPEKEGLLVTGRILPGNSLLQDTSFPVYLSVPGNNFKFSRSVTSISKPVKFNVGKFYGSHELISQAEIADSNYRVSIDNPFSDKFSPFGIEPINLIRSYKAEIIKRSIGVQSDNFYQPGKKVNYILPANLDTTAFFGFPSRTYYLDDYTRFHSMEEVMREYVKEVHVRNRQNTFHYEVYNELEKLYFNEDPLVLIDGVPVFNINKIMEVDPLRIKKIDITTTRFFLGSRAYDGIVSYSTYNGDLEGYELAPGSNVIEYDGLQFEREFYSPQYETAQQSSTRIPDFRNVLYWLPHLKTINGRQDISFYTSDVPGKYLIVAQGISDGGFVGTSTLSFIVNK